MQPWFCALIVGCAAYYHLQLADETRAARLKNSLRSYRRGIAFGFLLMRRGFYPKKILEYGPGDGYFARGLTYVFPEARVTGVDIVADVLEGIRRDHQMNGIRGEPGQLQPTVLSGIANTFDLVVARDVLEHLSAPELALREAHQLLKPGGLFHFLTPNGPEDAWGIRLAYRQGDSPSELLLNHVNYFDASGLKRKLKECGFRNRRYYIYNVKWFLRGRGWLKRRKLQAARSTARRVRPFLEAPTNKTIAVTPTEVTSSKWFKIRAIGMVYAMLKDVWLVRLPPSAGIGHEIFGLFQKRKI